MKPIVVNKDCEVDLSKIKIESLATNASLICYIKDKGILLINYPDAWDMYLPFYATNIFDINIKGDNAKEVINNVEKFSVKKGIDRNFKKQQLINLFKSEYKVNQIELSDCIYNHQVIKYSKTGLNYRFYNMDFYCLKYVDIIDNIINSDNSNQVFIPLDYKYDKINNKDIVDNILHMIKDEKIKKEIEKNMIN